MHSCVHHHVMFICRLLVAVWTSQFVVDSSTLPYSFTSCSIPLYCQSYLLCRRAACVPPPLCYIYRRCDVLRREYRWKYDKASHCCWVLYWTNTHTHTHTHTHIRVQYTALTDSFKSIRNVEIHLGACLDEWDPVLLGHLGTLLLCYFLRTDILRKFSKKNIRYVAR